MNRWARLVHLGIALTMAGFFASMVWMVLEMFGYREGWSSVLPAVAAVSAFFVPWVVAAVGVAWARPWARGFALGLALLAAPASIALLVHGATALPAYLGAAQATVFLLFLPGVRAAAGGHWRLSWSTAVLGMLAPWSVGLALLAYGLCTGGEPLTGLGLGLGSACLVLAIVGLTRNRAWGLFSAAGAVVALLVAAGVQQLESAHSDADGFVGAGMFGLIVLVGVAPWLGPVVRHLRGR